MAAGAQTIPLAEPDTGAALAGPLELLLRAGLGGAIGRQPPGEDWPLPVGREWFTAFWSPAGRDEAEESRRLAVGHAFCRRASLLELLAAPELARAMAAAVAEFQARFVPPGRGSSAPWAWGPVSARAALAAVHTVAAAALQQRGEVVPPEAANLLEAWRNREPLAFWLPDQPLSPDSVGPGDAVVIHLLRRGLAAVLAAYTPLLHAAQQDYDRIRAEVDRLEARYGFYERRDWFPRTAGVVRGLAALAEARLRDTRARSALLRVQSAVVTVEQAAGRLASLDLLALPWSPFDPPPRERPSEDEDADQAVRDRCQQAVSLASWIFPGEHGATGLRRIPWADMLARDDGAELQRCLVRRWAQAVPVEPDSLRAPLAAAVGRVLAELSAASGPAALLPLCRFLRQWLLGGQQPEAWERLEAALAVRRGGSRVVHYQDLIQGASRLRDAAQRAGAESELAACYAVLRRPRVGNITGEERLERLAAALSGAPATHGTGGG
ncbi:MAG: hypothetical protein HYU66_00590 [Armatimonadetes bacterium]|nr:hypothetical protein [Armatimonadota bacterium]